MPRSRVRVRVAGVLPALAALLVSGLVYAGSATSVAAAPSARTSTVPASADAYTRRTAPTVTTGWKHRWMTDGRAGGSKRAYLKFVVPAPGAGMQVSQVTLSAYVEQTAAADSSGLTVYRTGQKWAEGAIDWANQPALRDRVATTNPAYLSGEWVSWDVTDGLDTAEVQGGGTVSFAVTTEEKRQIEFASRESAHPARLSVTTSPATGSGIVDPDVQAAVVHGWGVPVAGDEFGYEGAPDPTLWSVYDSVGHHGEGIRSPAAWHVDGNVVTVSGDAQGTTGGMAALFDRRTYGRWEVRMRTSARDPEYHPVLLLWPDSGPTDRCPEIDYGEGSGDTTKVSFFLHYACDSQQTYAKRTIDTTQWHNYAVDWSATAITGYVDGVKWFEDKNPAHQPAGSMHQTIQLDWFPDGSTTTPSWMQVDWVRVYAAPVPAFPRPVNGPVFSAS